MKNGTRTQFIEVYGLFLRTNRDAKYWLHCSQCGRVTMNTQVLFHIDLQFKDNNTQKSIRFLGKNIENTIVSLYANTKVARQCYTNVIPSLRKLTTEDQKFEANLRFPREISVCPPLFLSLINKRI